MQGGAQIANKSRPRGITVVALLMIIFGLAEVVTGFTHRFFGISTSTATIFTYAAAAIGGFYVASGLLILTMKKWAAFLAIAFLVADVAGRIALADARLYPLSSFEQIFALVAGTVIAIVFAIYIAAKWKLYK
jgi:hypothetical protein